MLTILVAHSYFLRFDRKQQQRAKPYPPLATLQVASWLRAAGHSVSVFDAMLADGLDEYDALLRAVRPQLLLLYEDSFNFLSKMCLQRMREAACDMISRARADGARVIAVGSDASDAPEPYLCAGADAVLMGEGLPTLQTLVARLHADPCSSLNNLTAGQSGLAYRSDGRVHSVAAQRRPSASQSIDRPAWDLVDIERYRAIWRGARGYFSLNMATSRGCSFRCNWCAKPIWGHQYLQRDADDVAAEMAELKQRFRPDHIWFADDIFGFRADWVTRFAQALHARAGAIPFTIQTRADLTSVAMARALKAAGCVEVWLGAESGSQRVLDAMHKGITIDEILSARTRLAAEGIRVGFFIQLGYLGEELEDILATRSLIERAAPDDVGVSVSYPLPGTPFYEQVKQQLGDKTRWQESNDLAMMFHGRYQSDFYRRVRDLLHEQVSVQRSGEAAQRLAARWQGLLATEAQWRSDASAARAAS